MSISISDKIAVVTGASKGIGRATAQLLRQEGFIVYGLARHIETGKFNRRCDVARESSVRKIFSALEKEAGRIDVLVNSAGIAHQADPLAIKTGDWEKVFAVNVTGTFLCCRQALAGMKRRGYGRIINLGSVAARSYSRSASAAYTSSKYAVVGLTRHLAAAFVAYGVTINCVCPSQTNTEMLRKALSKAEIKAVSGLSPLGRLAEPEEVARTILFLAGPASSYVNGAVIDVNGGLL